ncbi:hypothetical protein EJ08DRAFT_399682 [Tothia fuscella]|uniref:Secreted protein n=1 Tax=Tothia fuscella TaxID=1048955 RepID=A0A9P4NKP3_9PEZI|nr:hypothetical protein EJ08DRAFT_399682 [Tothia fuscella]
MDSLLQGRIIDLYLLCLELLLSWTAQTKSRGPPARLLAVSMLGLMHLPRSTSVSSRWNRALNTMPFHLVPLSNLMVYKLAIDGESLSG